MSGVVVVQVAQVEETTTTTASSPTTAAPPATTTTTTAAPAGPPAGTNTGRSGADLPRTGSSPAALAAVGLVALVLAGVLTLRGARPRG